jgi:hypothetical protein
MENSNTNNNTGDVRNDGLNALRPDACIAASIAVKKVVAMK